MDDRNISILPCSHPSISGRPGSWLVTE